ncbi:RNA polymerase sigma factor (sigma-70 family) [Geomicrobium halophilum]|uniref:RNA polymerase sigma factor (Sigma-70 family) n=1 Tax=Geomicrobium halophilum TaxID=549000 RepID=A0A841PN43_9BACL|nr:sigma-70 family RNA polymerase sigma factor [Geomicrobium halophilum]MBB6450267.1 RNA polymerase sigma factor (sigma-70 family) [Geomicrobium halophilum]
MMIEQLKDECSCMQAFLDDHPQILEHRIFQGFLKDPHYYRIFVHAICSPSLQTIEDLNEAFKSHYANVQFTQYLSKTLHWTSINYDRKRRNLDQKQILLDKPWEDGTTGNPLLDEFSLSRNDEKVNLEFVAETNDLSSWSSDITLTKALLRLTSRQRTIIIEHYGNGRKNSEIARLLNISQQAVSRTHLHALKRLRSMLEKEGD